MLIEDRVLNTVSNILEIERNRIKNSKGLKWDSLKHISLVTALENEFDVFFEPDEISEMLSYNKLVNIVKTKVEQN